MSLKGKVTVVLTFLVVLIGSAGTTVFGGLQLGQGELDAISDEAETIDSSTLPLLIAAATLKEEAAQIARAPDSNAPAFDRALTAARDAARAAELNSALGLLDEMERARRNGVQGLPEVAARFADWAEERARDEMMVLGHNTAALRDANRTLKALVLGFTGVGLLIALYGAVWLYRNINTCIALVQRDIGVLSEYAASTDNEDAPVELALDGTRTDEFGTIGDALAVLAEYLAQGKALARSTAERNAEKLQQAERLEQITGGFSDHIGEIIRAVSAAATELESTARSMTTTAEQNSRQSTSMAASAGQALENVKRVAVESERLGRTIDQIGREISNSSDISERAGGEADRTNEVVKDLSDAALRITEVTTLISDIAGQTNLLALNATIEAARAGEAGKGFAVVAQEVKNLANQTGRATDDITQQINTVQEETQSAVGAIETIRGTIREMTGITTRVAAAINELDSAVREICRNAEEAATGTDSVTENIDSVSRTVQETGDSSAQVLQASAELSRQAERLRGEIERFIVEVRAA
ncbi:MAG: methyl-accepting chemotaxis protein [Rhodospirillales bacterium]|nr:MAG: methyl-accepting chemotaxis protein [Rhodospirillales bacterium]